MKAPGRGQFGDGPAKKPSFSILGNRTSSRFAVVIGNHAYGEGAALPNAVNDAKGMAQALVALGFAVALGSDLDGDGMIDALAEIEEHTKIARDVVLFYYAGHGLQYDGNNYLVPIRVSVGAPADLRRTLDLETILKTLTSASPFSIVMLDSCRDNPFTRSLWRYTEPSTNRNGTGELPKTGRVRGGLATVSDFKSTFIAFAAAPNEVAYDGAGSNSPFTAAILKYIHTPNVTIFDVMVDVTNEVLRETKGRQAPWVQGSIPRKFFFVDASPPKVERPAELDREKARAEFAKIMKNPTIATLTQFKERFPDFGYAVDAEIEKLRRDAEERLRVELENNPPSSEIGQPAGAGRRSRRREHLKRLLGQSGNTTNGSDNA